MEVNQSLRKLAFSSHRMRRRSSPGAASKLVGICRRPWRRLRAKRAKGLGVSKNPSCLSLFFMNSQRTRWCRFQHRTRIHTDKQLLHLISPAPFVCSGVCLRKKERLTFHLRLSFSHLDTALWKVPIPVREVFSPPSSKDSWTPEDKEEEETYPRLTLLVWCGQLTPQDDRCGKIKWEGQRWRSLPTEEKWNSLDSLHPFVPETLDRLIIGDSHDDTSRIALEMILDVSRMTKGKSQISFKE